MFSLKDIKQTIDGAAALFSGLTDVYGQIPATECRRRVSCCALVPEMTFAEALFALDRMKRLPVPARNQVVLRLVTCFFTNAVEISACPFLEANGCLIYPDRFFGCRAYGLWSLDTYQERSEAGLAAKKSLQVAWRSMGVVLPDAVVNFRQPYCRDVKVTEKTSVDDDFLKALEDQVEILSQGMGEGHEVYLRTYGGDFSFLIAALLLGTREAVSRKVAFVKAVVARGNQSILEETRRKLPKAHLF